MALIAALAAFGCSDDDSPEKPGSDGGNGSSDLDRYVDGAQEPELVWSKNLVDPDWAGKQASLAATPDGLVGVAYYRKRQEDVTVDCPASGLTGGGPQPRPAHDLYYVQSSDGTTWADPVQVGQNIGSATQGLSLAHNPVTGEMHLGFLGGEVSTVECSSSDAILATSADGQSWTTTTLASAGPFAGDTVGYWMAVAVDSAGQPHAAYRDVRFGYYEHDGHDKASTLYDNGDVISAEDASGAFNNLVFDPEDRPVVAFYRDRLNQEIMLGVRKGESWDLQQLRHGETAEAPSLATDGNGVFGLAYYNTTKQTLQFMESQSQLQDWQDKLVDPNLTNNGKYASLAYDSQGNPAISYYQCGAYQSGGQDECSFGKDGLLFAYRQNNKWTIQTVDTGDSNRCGTYTSLAFLPGDEPIIAYQCVSLNADNEFVDTLKVAKGHYQ